MNSRGFSSLIVLLIAAVVIGLGVYFYTTHQTSQKPVSISIANSSSATTTPSAPTNIKPQHLSSTDQANNIYTKTILKEYVPFTKFASIRSFLQGNTHIPIILPNTLPDYVASSTNDLYVDAEASSTGYSVEIGIKGGAGPGMLNYYGGVWARDTEDYVNHSDAVQKDLGKSITGYYFPISGTGYLAQDYFVWNYDGISYEFDGHPQIKIQKTR